MPESLTVFHAVGAKTFGDELSFIQRPGGLNNAEQMTARMQ